MEDKLLVLAAAGLTHTAFYKELRDEIERRSHRMVQGPGVGSDVHHMGQGVILLRRERE